MKLKLLLGILFVAGAAAALAVAAPSHAVTGTTTTTSSTTTTTTTTTGKKHGDDEHEHGNKHGDNNSQNGDGEKSKRSCQNVELHGTGSGSIALTVARASDRGSSLVGKQATLTIPTGSRVNAQVCVDASGAITLRGVEVKTPKSTTTTTSTGTTTTTP